jgi:hypothetical protein
MVLAAAVAGAIVAGGITSAVASTRGPTPEVIGDLYICTNNSTKLISQVWSTTVCPTGSYKYVVPQRSGGTGAQGVPGPQGPAGATGPQGPAGAPGATGKDGKDGTDGKDAPAATYGVGNINVSRGGALATTWQQLSTDLGSPVGDTVSGTFRFTCSTAKAPCAVSVSAYATTSGVTVYPRVLITKDSIDTGAPLGTCEYGDGSDNNGAVTALSNAAVAVPLGIGGSLDCGSAQAYPANGVASTIEVPAGYYNVTSTLQFFKS